MSAVTTAEWGHFAGLYPLLLSPLSPHGSDIARISAAIDGHDDKVLMLGVTPKLAQVGKSLVAIDGNAAMIATVWPGDDRRRRAVEGHWTATPFDDGAFDSVVGDGSLNCVPGGTSAVMAEVRRVLKPGGRAAFRLFAAPAEREALEDVVAAVDAGQIGNFHALKWRIAMAIVAADSDYAVPAASVRDTFDDLFPDRDALAETTGWSATQVATIDAYKGTTHSLAFPPADVMLDWARPFLGDGRIVESSGYPLAERTPLLVWTRPA